MWGVFRRGNKQRLLWCLHYTAWSFRLCIMEVTAWMKDTYTNSSWLMLSLWTGRRHYRGVHIHSFEEIYTIAYCPSQYCVPCRPSQLILAISLSLKQKSVVLYVRGGGLTLRSMTPHFKKDIRICLDLSHKFLTRWYSYITYTWSPVWNYLFPLRWFCLERKTVFCIYQTTVSFLSLTGTEVLVCLLASAQLCFHGTIHMYDLAWLSHVALSLLFLHFQPSQSKL